MNIQALRDEIHTQYPIAGDDFDPAAACRARVDYLVDFLHRTGLGGFVLGISGGVDSLLAGRLAQMACEAVRAAGGKARFVAMRLPANRQADEKDARAALDFIRPDDTLTVDIGPASDIMSTACVGGEIGRGEAPDAAAVDFHKGNIKARMRMIAQYHVAGRFNLAVLGTDHPSEAVTGFFTKFGDGACDLTVLNGLSKPQIRQCAGALGAPPRLCLKVPTADLEEINPGKPDEEGFGFPYADLDAFMAGKSVPAEIEARILERYAATRHKREPIPGFIG